MQGSFGNATVCPTLICKPLGPGKRLVEPVSLAASAGPRHTLLKPSSIAESPLLARAAQGVPAGTRITVLSTDPAARYDVPAWARMRGHTIVTDVPGWSGEDDVVAITVLLGSDD